MTKTSTGELLIGELLDGPQRFDEGGRAHDLLQAYFSGLPIETLRPLLQSDNVWIHRAAGFVAAELGKRSRSLVEDVVPLLESSDRHVQNYAMEVLTVCCEDEYAETFGYVVRKLESDDEGIRLQAMDLVANADVLQLEAAARFFAGQPDGEAHQLGLRALATVDHTTTDAARALLEDPEPLLQRYGSIAMKRIGQSRPKAEEGL